MDCALVPPAIEVDGAAHPTTRAPISARKICSKCKVAKPMSAFNRRMRHPDGLSYQCRACITAHESSRRTDRAAQAAGAGTKQCKRCGVVKDMICFGRHIRYKDGLRSVCKPCTNAAFREWQSRSRQVEQGGDELVKLSPRAAVSPKPPKTMPPCETSEGQLRNCTGCQETKPLSNFNRSAKGPTGFCRECRMCQTVFRKAYTERQRQQGRHSEHRHQHAPKSNQAAAPHIKAPSNSSSSGTSAPPSECASPAGQLKTCRQCNMAKPRGDFNRMTASRDGLQANCRACQRRAHYLWRKALQAVPKTDPMSTQASPAAQKIGTRAGQAEPPSASPKTCRRCGAPKLLADFNKKGRGGVRSECSDCRAVAHKLWQHGGQPGTHPAYAGSDSCTSTSSDSGSDESTPSPPAQAAPRPHQATAWSPAARELPRRQQRQQAGNAKPAEPPPRTSQQQPGTAVTCHQRGHSNHPASACHQPLPRRRDAQRKTPVPPGPSRTVAPAAPQPADGQTSKKRRLILPQLGGGEDTEEAGHAQLPPPGALVMGRPGAILPVGPQGTCGGGQGGEAAAASVRPVLTDCHPMALQQRMLQKLGPQACAALLRKDVSLPAASLELVIRRYERLVEEASMMG